jgi:hypothetical protein
LTIESISSTLLAASLPASQGEAMELTEKVNENRVRRMAERQRLTLHRTRRRDRRASDFGLYWVERESPAKGPAVLIETDNLGHIERWLKGDSQMSVLNRDPIWVGDHEGGQP